MLTEYYRFVQIRFESILTRSVKGCKMVYTTQRDRHWNMIVCKGDRERDGYRIIYTGSYNACLAVKANGGAI